MIPPTLTAMLAGYDEAALVAVANKGLHRRAQRDVEEGKAVVKSVDGDTATVDTDGDTVVMDARGPKAARCTCPAPGVCRHRLAAVLLLQTHILQTQILRTQTGGGESAAPDVAAEVAALALDTLRSWAGKAAWRGAVELLEGGATVIAEGAALVVAFPRDGPQVRILPGQGLDGLVSKVAPALRKTYHTAAVLVARRHLGVGDAVEATAAEVAVAGGIEPVDAAFLGAVTAVLGECVRVGFNLAPLSLEERLFTLSVSSRADALPRLAGLLRALSAQIRSRRARDFAFDPDRCLDLCGKGFALISALKHDDGGDPDRSSLLRGQARRDYSAAGVLRLYGSGAEAWSTASGARGVTAYFYDPTQDRWLTVALARGAGQDPWFEPRTAYSNESLWGGPTIKAVSQAQIGLTGASVSPDGRLSAGKDVRVTETRPVSADEAAGWPCCCGDWDALRRRLVERLAGGVAGPARGAEPVLLRPQRVARPFFDDLAQTLVWPVADANGQWLCLSLEHGADPGRMVKALEAIAAGWDGLVAALATVDGRVFRLRPYAVMDGATVCNLGLDPLPGGAIVRAWGGCCRT
ncbi:SWIM zinc finger family protein [Asticcacaulis biprosthecium C19]|uniref:SWIM zinc finger family protein n=1 Tax=Asticcacaulis biprosthecium C19 TaxID=715226 RepID=F4QNU4_9CAUL|nr:hypothetical protein [Asticcacaulis biprosthecium]EGF91002.1 SWIM zinc finger family protein [Asticcacaulis biprosthecium C19]